MVFYTIRISNLDASIYFFNFQMLKEQTMFFALYLFVLQTAVADEAVLISEGGETKKADEPPKSPQYTGPKISVDFYKADIHAVMRFFAEVGSKNIIVDESVSGTVSLRLEAVYWEEAFRAVLWSQGLGAQNIDSLILVR